MSVTRKQFLGLVATGVAGAVSWSPRRLLAESAPQAYSPEMFEPVVGDTFHITSVAQEKPIDPLDVTLEKVTRVGTENETIQFSLEFTGPVGDALPSRTYLFENAKLGQIPMFVAPARRDGQGRTLYRADFNILQNARSTVIAPARSRR
jgi:hypothetical protein